MHINKCNIIIELMVTRGEGWWVWVVWEFGADMYTLLCLKWITNKDLLYSMGNSAQCYVAAWDRRGVRGRMDACTRMAESLCCVHLKL